jgi:2-polyprenyl-3-methyl-5-hydroxy-6-metoxy-1,4-benzoquinol methylase
MSEPISLQRTFWNGWNTAHREPGISEVSLDQRSVIVEWFGRLGRANLRILEVGCGAAWLCPWLKPYGEVTATDLSDEVLRRAGERVSGVHFIAGDFMSLPFDQGAFDVVVSIEVLSHVADQQSFVEKLAALTAPGGLLMLATQNRPALQRFNKIDERMPGQIRRWVDRVELEALLLKANFEVCEIRPITPRANRGPLRLIAGRHARSVLRFISGRSFETALARHGLAWTLMALARKR